MSQRMFLVVVKCPGKRPFAYPPVDGEKALKTMQTLKTRGHDSIAETTANGITEHLSVDQMKMIFG